MVYQYYFFFNFLKKFKDYDEAVNQQQDDESKAINISRISEVSRSKENSDQFSNQKFQKNNANISSKSNNPNLRNEDSVNPNINSNSNNMLNMNDLSSKYNSKQDSFQPSKLIHNPDSKTFKENKNTNKSKNLKLDQIKDLQSLGSDHEYNNDANLYHDEMGDEYNYINDTDSLNLDRVNMNMEESLKLMNKMQNTNNNHVINIHHDIGNNKSTNQQPSVSNKTSSRPLTANNKGSSISNRLNQVNNNKYLSNHSNKKSQKSRESNNNISKNKSSGINSGNKFKNLYNNPLYNKNKSASKKSMKSNTNNGSKSDISMSSVHSYDKQKNSIANNNNQFDLQQRNNYVNKNIGIMNKPTKEIIHEEINNDINEENEVYDNQIPYQNNNDHNAQYNENYIKEVEAIDENEAEQYANDESLKEDILKEFRRIYGNKIDKLLIRSQLQNSTNILELILNNVKLARNKMMKLSNNNLDPDDLAVLNYIFNKFFILFLFRPKNFLQNIRKN